ncbi:hypothetical protein BV22DRAFT_1034817 [Leucogyrophana mollusca]|uniref:Uncharacterized protein n=1 Tax=Leucogyrophana mollusca TaxID=85980 RepID=A0ACB8BGA5_9AGAM|nr:hypothetical protein BV22DRAFT_1034817 [Leucogyrophana mollusca]
MHSATVGNGLKVPSGHILEPSAIMHHSHRQGWTVAAILLAGVALAQENGAACDAKLSYGWMVNSHGQDPCLVANTLVQVTPAPCGNTNVVFNGFNGGVGYIGTAFLSEDANMCICNTVLYSLACACSVCQNASLISWSEWSSNCPENQIVNQNYPATIPTGTSIPPWAYMAVEGSWNSVEAQINASAQASIPASLASDQPGQPTTPSSGQSTSSQPGQAVSSKSVQSTLSPSASSTSTSSTSTSHTGEVVGGVVGGVAFVSVLAFGGFLVLRRSQRGAVQNTPEPDDLFATQPLTFVPPPQITKPRPYDPNDPSTFPGRSERVYSMQNGANLPVSNPDAGYTGIPEI